MKLTQARRRALEFAARHTFGRFVASNLSRAALAKLVGAGLIARDGVSWSGIQLWKITPKGREAVK